jgi:hypothetical protein
MGLLVRHLYGGLADSALWQPLDEAGREWAQLEADTRRYAQGFQRLSPGIAYLELSAPSAAEVRLGAPAAPSPRYDKTLLLLLGQEREPVSIVVDRDSVAVAAGFESGYNFLTLLGLSGGMPTRVSVPRKRLPELLRALGADPAQVGV